MDILLASCMWLVHDLFSFIIWNKRHSKPASMPPNTMKVHGQTGPRQHHLWWVGNHCPSRANWKSSSNKTMLPLQLESAGNCHSRHFNLHSMWPITLAFTTNIKGSSLTPNESFIVDLCSMVVHGSICPKSATHSVQDLVKVAALVTSTANKCATPPTPKKQATANLHNGVGLVACFYWQFLQWWAQNSGKASLQQRFLLRRHCFWRVGSHHPC